jgi:hypothetical protein
VAVQGGMVMRKYSITMYVTAFAVGALLGFGVSDRSGIQPGYFEKQEAPAYGVSGVKALGSDLGKDYEEHFKSLYKE